MRIRTLLSATAAAGLALALLTGCSGDGGGEGGPVTLDYLSLAWQKESVEANKKLVARWNATHKDVKVKYVQGSWDTAHDQLLTSFEGGEAPDVIHDDASDLTDFAYGGYLADLSGMLPQSLRSDIPEQAWKTTRFNGGTYGVPFLQEPRVLIANTKLLKQSGVRIPTPDKPWTMGEFEDVAKKLTVKGKRYGVAWAMKEPVTQSLNLAPAAGGRVFYKKDGKNVIRYGANDSAAARMVNRQVNRAHTAPRSSLTMGGSDTLPGLFAGKYAMVPLNFSYRQQVAQQAPKGFDWTVLPMPSGPGSDGQAQGNVPQTLSVAQDSRHKQAAADFVAYMTQPEHQAVLAKGDWLLPTSTAALRDPGLNTKKDGWSTGVAVAGHLTPAPALGVRGYPEWKDKIATPAYQQYYSGAYDLDQLRDKLVGDGNRVLNRYQR
jgi:ABC-type glycerol-3-phosphate transport system substrate-binding protein